MTTALKALPEASGQDIEKLVHLSRGNFRKAINLLKTNETDQYNIERFKELMRFAYGRKFLDLFSWVTEVSNIGRERQKSFLQYAMGLVRENFMNNMNTPELVFMDKEEQDFSSKFSTIYLMNETSCKLQRNWRRHSSTLL